MVPFLDLIGQYRSIKEEIGEAIAAVLDSGQYVLGPAVERFEKDFAAFSGVGHAIACSSGTAALHLALVAAGVKAGDEVITVPMTFLATVSAITYANATPVFVDIEPSTSTMDPELVEAAITPRTKAILPVHLYGQPADMKRLRQIAERHGLTLIEDAAQAHGAEFYGRRAGSIGDVGCFSFYPGKNLGAYGEGGIVTTNNEQLAERVRTLRDWGQVGKYNHAFAGFNYRMDGIQGAVLGVKLRYIEKWTEARRNVAATYDRLLAHAEGVDLPKEVNGRRHVWHVYGVKIAPAQRGRVISELRTRGIATGLHYPVPVHLQPCFANLGYELGDFPVSEALALSELSLPMYPELLLQQIEEVVGALRSAVVNGALTTVPR